MNENHPKVWKRRSGFTLIELLVVIAIIGILASLLMVAIITFLRKGPVVTTRNSMLQVSEALQKFKTDVGRYPPAQIRLRANMLDYTKNRVDPLDDASVSFLSTMFKNLGGATNIQWAGATPMPAGGIILEGDQCLVFFLGGPPNGGGQPGLMGGFATGAQDPVAGSGSRKKYMDFETARLFNRGGHPFPSYADAFDMQQPLVYFSSSGFVNTPSGGRFGTSYDTLFFTGPGVTQATNTLGVRPYALQVGPPPKFQMSDSYQIVSAGQDGKFGPGGLWAPPATVATGAGADDMTNISDKIMGAQ